MLIQYSFDISKRIWFGFIGLFTALQLFSEPVDAANREIDLHYDISWGALHLAEVRSQWQLQDSKVFVLGSVKSEGIAKLLSGFQSASNAELDLIGDKWHPNFLTLSSLLQTFIAHLKFII